MKVVKFISPMHRRRYFHETPQGQNAAGMKIPDDTHPYGVEPATSRLEAQCVNQLRHHLTAEVLSIYGTLLNQ